MLPTGASLSAGLVSKAVKETFLLGIEDNVPGIFENKGVLIVENLCSKLSWTSLDRGSGKAVFAE